MGIVQPYDISILPELLHMFAQQYPKVKFEILVGTTMELAKAVKENRIDVALCSLPHEENFVYEELFQEELCCITSIHNPLTINKPADFEGCHFYRFNDDSLAHKKSWKLSCQLRAIDPLGICQQYQYDSLLDRTNWLLQFSASLYRWSDPRWNKNLSESFSKYSYVDRIAFKKIPNAFSQYYKRICLWIKKTFALVI